MSANATTKETVRLAVYRDEIAARRREDPYGSDDDWHDDAVRMAVKASSAFELAMDPSKGEDIG